MTTFNDVIANELVRRVRKMSTEDLLKMAKNGVAVSRKGGPVRAASKSGTHRIELPKAEASQVTIAEAVMQAVMEAKGAKLTTADMVAGAQVIRPDAQEATIRAEISKLTAGGLLVRTGPRVGGTYSASKGPGLQKVANG